jgi:hypothetical protein
MSVVVFWMGRNALNAASPYGIMSETRRRMLWATVFVLLSFLYAVTFNRELRDNPLVAAGILLLLSTFVVWRVSKWRASAD